MMRLQRFLVMAAMAAIVGSAFASTARLDEAMIWPFPDRLSAYVWRNWTMVPKARLAEAVGATPEDLTRIAAEMGLPAQERIAPEWDTLGRKSIIRRNWNLVPRCQWQKLVPPNPNRHSNSDEGEDILKWQFGGGGYPDLPELRYDADEACKSCSERREIAAAACAARRRTVSASAGTGAGTRTRPCGRFRFCRKARRSWR